MSDRPSLLPPATTALERGLEQASARIDDIPPAVRSAWNADTCPAEVLPWLAWAFGVEDWRDYWSEATKRDVVRNAIPLRRIRGTRKAVEDVVRSFGASLIVQEWWETSPPGTPHTFALVVNYGGAALTTEFQQDVLDQVTRAKPLRSHFVISLGLQAEAGINITAHLRTATYTRLNLEG